MIPYIRMYGIILAGLTRTSHHDHLLWEGEAPAEPHGTDLANGLLPPRGKAGKGESRKDGTLASPPSSPPPGGGGIQGCRARSRYIWNRGEGFVAGRSPSLNTRSW